MVLLSDGRVLVVGGRSLTAQVYNPDTGTFSETGQMVHPAEPLSAVLLQDGKVLVVGTGDAPDTGAELYDPVGGSFSEAGSVNVLRMYPTVTRLNDGRVLIAGGRAISGGPGFTCFASAEVYDPATGKFTLTGSMHAARENATATVLPDGRVLIVGGDLEPGGPNQTVLSSAEVYDPSTGRFSQTGSMTIARTLDQATPLPNGQVLITGGWSFKLGAALSTAELYDPATSKFTLTGSMGTARMKHTATPLPDGRVLVAGGTDYPWGSNAPLNSTVVYDPRAGTFSPSGAMTIAREAHTAVALKDGRVLIVGGSGDADQSAEIYWP